MSNWLYILKSLFFHRRINFAVALGVAAATAVLTGALIVGDSMRGSLRDITLDRLGKIDELLVSDLFFREEMASELSDRPEFKQNYDRAISAIYLMAATAEKVASSDTTSDSRATSNLESDTPRRIEKASGVTIIGCTSDFWKLGDSSLADMSAPENSEIVINQQLADELGIRAEQVEAARNDPKAEPVLVTIRIARQQTVAADSPIAAKEVDLESIPRLKVIRVLPNKSIARFGMQPSQILPSNAFVSLELLQEKLDQPGRVNSIFVGGKAIGDASDEEASRSLRAALHPTLDDMGLLLRSVDHTFEDNGQEKSAFSYQSLSSTRMMIPPETDSVLKSVLADEKADPVFTYLAKKIAIVRDNVKPDEEESIPFSMVTAIEFGDDFQLESIDGELIDKLADDEIILNRWAADNIGANVGDRISLAFFEPETSYGETVDQVVEFKLRAIAELVEPDSPYNRVRDAVYKQRPTLANDPDLTPLVPGITDSESISNWSVPFETPGIDGEDDRYWANYRTTPKAFISLKKGRQLWTSRFGETTSYRISATSNDGKQLNANVLAKKINEKATQTGANLGLNFLPLKRDGLSASSGSTPFDALFLSLSFFIIASAIMLVTLLFRLGIEQRANEIGVLNATGVDRGKVTRLMIGEGMLVSLLGGLLGLAIGIGYAWLMLTGLTTIWVEAIVTPFLELHIGWKTLLIGLISGVAICAITIAITMMRTRLHSIRSLLAGQLEQSDSSIGKRRNYVATALAVVCLFAAIGLSIAAIYLPGGEAQAGAFVGSGFLLLTGMLIVIWIMLRSGNDRNESASKDIAGQLSMFRVAMRNAGRKPGRSALTIGLVAIATFLIVAISSFHLAPTEQGTGGFQWVAQSDQPIHFDLNDTAKLRQLYGEESANWDIGKSLAMRLKPGADASCNNPYQITQPRVLGITSADIEQLGDKDSVGFAWAGSLAGDQSERENPWLLLDKPLNEPDRIPVVIDKNTAMYSLKIFSVGQDFELTYDENHTIKFRVAGFLANSILQGSLLISEKNFVKEFPDIGGYRYFLVRGKSDSNGDSVATGDIASSKSNASSKSVEEIESGLQEYGFDLRNANKMLESLLAVQNTYLKAFQSLGSLGLLLGTFGLATVQLRNVFERRRELALLSAVGFSNSRLGRLVLIEHVILLLGGILVGILAAFFAVVPHVWFGNAVVPWTQLVILLGTITVVGLLTGLFAVRSSLKTPVLAALRGE